MSGYALGVDLGTTFTAAATSRDGQVRVVHLGQRAAAIPSVVFLRDDDTIMTGDAAVRRGIAEPDRVAREFKRRVGDPAPILLGGVPMSADALLARLLAWTVDAVSEREGGPPERVAVCHPANWGPYKLELLAQSARRAGLTAFDLVSEPEAAAIAYADQERVERGARIAVYDLGGGTFDAAVLRKTADGFELLGAPEGIERLGGIDFDEAVVAHVMRHVGESVAALGDDAASIAALARVRQECIDAKEALSADSETSIPVLLPDLNTEVRLTRAELESMIRVPLLETVAALRRAVHVAGVEPADLAAVLLVGGSSRIPMVAQMVSAELGRPVAVDADPKHAIALGAALFAGRRADVAVGTSRPIPALAGGGAVQDAGAPGRAGTPGGGVGPDAPGEPAPPPVARHGPVPPGEPAPAPAPPAPAEPAALAHVPGRAGAPPDGSGMPADEPATSAGRAARVAAQGTAHQSTDTHAGTSRRPLLVLAAIVLAVALVGVGGALALGGGGRGDGSGGGEAAAGWVSPCPAAPSVCITSVSASEAGVSARFVANGVELVPNATGDELQAVFFLAAIHESEAAGVAVRTDTWEGWGPRVPFEGFAGELGSSTALCVLVGNGAGQVAPGTGNCAELPAGGGDSRAADGGEDPPGAPAVSAATPARLAPAEDPGTPTPTVAPAPADPAAPDGTDVAAGATEATGVTDVTDAADVEATGTAVPPEPTEPAVAFESAGVGGPQPDGRTDDAVGDAPPSEE